MGQINILITIDTNKLLADMPSGGEIPHPEKYAFVQDDEAFETNDANPAEITTLVQPGTILMWTIKSLTSNHRAQLTGISAKPGIYMEEPVIFCDRRKCVAVISKMIETSVKYGYYIEFFIDGNASKTWYWDPYVEEPPKPTRP